MLPRRLTALKAHLGGADDVFADWQLSRAEPITKFFRPHEFDIVTEAARRFVPVAGDFSGGVLVLDLRAGDPERAPVISFGSDGSIVLGETFDDFLALLGSEQPDSIEDCWTADQYLRAWIRASGIAPHESATSRLAELAELTRQFSIEWTSALRRATATIRPSEVVEHRLVLGESIAGVRLGMSRAELDARWGGPNIPTWSRTGRGATALYESAPVTVRVDESETRVTAVTLFAGRHRAVTTDGSDLMFQRASEVMGWLRSIGLEGVREGRMIRIPAARTSLTLSGRIGAGETEPWVVAVTLSADEAAR